MPRLAPAPSALGAARRLLRALRRGSWAWPFLLSLVFAAATGAWLQKVDNQEREEERRTLIADVLTLESRLSDRLDSESNLIRRLAVELPRRVSDDWLLREPTVTRGLQRLWVSVTVLDSANRLRAHVPSHTPLPEIAVGASLDDPGVTTHLTTPLRSGGQLIVRVSPTLLLRQTVPWWISRTYDVRLVDDYGQRIASSGETLSAPGQPSYRVSMEPNLPDAYLELIVREVRAPWWRTLPLLLMAVFVVLSAGASWTLRRQMLAVEAAKNHWRTEAAWRRAIEDSLTVGLRGRDLDGRLVHVNRTFCQLVGFAPEQLLGRVPPMPYWMPDTLDDSMQRLQRNLAGGAPREGYEVRLRHADGHAIDVMVYEAPLIDDQGRHLGWMGSIVDITERKRFEERERRQLERLGNQARLTTLGEVASALAHQLNQPLAAIASYNAGVVRTLQRTGPTDAFVLEALEREGEQIAEAGRIVQRIRAFLSRRAPQPERCQWAGIVQRALGLVRRDLQRQGVQLGTDLKDDLPDVMADPVLMEQVVINLVRNAADALAGHPEAHIAVQLRQSAPGWLRLDIDDNGPGLGELGIQELAAPFYSTKSDGMGMGLAICRSVVEAHRGALEASASPLGGARFSCRLPIVTAELASDPAAASGASGMVVG